jgi:hypothetical protein
MRLLDSVLRAFAAAVAHGDFDSAERLAALAFQIEREAVADAA